MKKYSVLFAACFLLSACGVPATPTGPVESISSENTTSQNTSVPDASSHEEASASALQAAPLEVPMPEEMPVKSTTALDLPANLAANAKEWNVALLTPAQYTIDMPLNRGGARGFLPSDVFFAKQDGKVTLFNENGKQISETGAYDSDTNISWVATNGTIPVKQGELYGLADVATGELLVPVEYTSVGASLPEFFEVTDSDRTTKLLRRGDLSVAFTIERGEKFGPVGKDFLAIYQNGTLKIAKRDGTPVKNMVCDEYQIVGSDDSLLGVNRIAIREGEKWGLYDENLELITNPIYDQFNPSFQGDYITFSKSGKWGIMDYSGKVTISPKWDDIILYPYSASLCLDNKWMGVMDLSKEITDLPIYDMVGSYSKEGYASFQKNGKYGLLDDDGNVMMTPRQSGEIFPHQPGFDDDVFLFAGDNGPGSYGIFCDGQLVMPTETFVYPQSVNPYAKESEEYSPVCMPNGKWGYVDSRGQLVIDTRFDSADGFIAGKDVAMVSLNGKICLIDRKGTVVLETVFTDCLAFSPATMVCAMRYTDRTGQTADCLVRLSSSVSS